MYTCIHVRAKHFCICNIRYMTPEKKINGGYEESRVLLLGDASGAAHLYLALERCDCAMDTPETEELPGCCDFQKKGSPGFRAMACSAVGVAIRSLERDAKALAVAYSQDPGLRHELEGASLGPLTI